MLKAVTDTPPVERTQPLPAVSEPGWRSTTHVSLMLDQHATFEAERTTAAVNGATYTLIRVGLDGDSTVTLFMSRAAMANLANAIQASL